MLISEQELRSAMQEVLDFFIEELKSIKTGRLSNESFQRIIVDTNQEYGAPSQLMSVVKISIVNSMRADIEVWDGNLLNKVQKALEESGLGLRVSPASAKNTLIVSISPLTTEAREQLVKDISKILEERKVRLRQVRQNYISKLDQMDKVSEDDKFRTKDRIQAILKDFEKKLEEIFDKKEKEILTI